MANRIYNDDIASDGGCRVWHLSDTYDHADLRAARLLGIPPRYSGHVADGTIWDINSTCAEFGPKCFHLRGIQYLTDPTAYLYCKGNVSALKKLTDGDFPGLSTVFGELDAMSEHVVEAWMAFIMCSVWSASREFSKSRPTSN